MTPEMEAPAGDSGGRGNINSNALAEQPNDTTARRSAAVADMLARAPARYRGILRRAYDGTGGRANAITAMCLDCTHYDPETVRSCTVYRCPMWEYRPYRDSAARGEKSASREQQEGADTAVPVAVIGTTEIYREGADTE